MQKREPLLIVRNERGPAVDYGVLLLRLFSSPPIPAIHILTFICIPLSVYFNQIHGANLGIPFSTSSRLFFFLLPSPKPPSLHQLINPNCNPNPCRLLANNFVGLLATLPPPISLQLRSSHCTQNYFSERTSQEVTAPYCDRGEST